MFNRSGVHSREARSLLDNGRSSAMDCSILASFVFAGLRFGARRIRLAGVLAFKFELSAQPRVKQPVSPAALARFSISSTFTHRMIGVAPSVSLGADPGQLLRGCASFQVSWEHPH